MTRQLYIVRHAESHSGHHYKTDIERELTPEGIHQVHELGKHLIESSVQIDLIITSPAQRAKTTALLIANSLNYPGNKIELASKIYSGNLNDLLKIVKEIRDSNQQVLLVGHNPTLLEFINFLSAVKKQSMSTCELTQLSSATNWHHTIEGSFHYVSGYRSANQ